MFRVHIKNLWNHHLDHLTITFLNKNKNGNLERLSDILQDGPWKASQLEVGPPTNSTYFQI